MNHRGIALLHPTGNANVRQAIEGFDTAGLLQEYATTVGRSTATPIPGWWPRSVAETLNKRSYDLPPERLSRRTREEVVRNLLLRSPARRIRRLAEPWQRFGINWVADRLDGSYATHLLRRSDRPRLLMAYQGMGSRSFDAAAHLAIPRLLEVTHAHWETTEAAYTTSIDRDPQWAGTISFPRQEGKSEVDEQLQSASLVLSPSRQVTASLSGRVPESRLMEVPYGCPDVAPSTTARAYDGATALRCLYVGRIQAGKGIAQLAHAQEVLGARMELTVIGAAPNTRSEALDSFLSASRYLGTQPREVVSREMERAQVFIMPSLVEGRSLAALEALSSGLAMVVTPGSGVDDLVEQGAGLVVPTGDAVALANALESIVDNPESVRQFSAEAISVARSNGWQLYRTSLLSAAAMLATEADH